MQPGICDKHGEYTAQTFEYDGRPGLTFCPICEKEKEDAERAANAKNMAEWAEREKLEAEAAAKKKAKDDLEDKGIRKRFYSTTFDTFEAKTPEQKHAHDRCRAFVAEKEANAETGKALFLLGRPGTGKNHLAVSIVREWGGDAIIKKASEIIRDVRSTYGTGQSEQRALSRLAAYDLLVINEVGIQFGTEAEKNLLFEILDERYESMRPTVFISNLNLQGVKDFVGARVIDRMMQCGEVLNFTWESYREGEK